MAEEEKGTAKERALERLRRHFDLLRRNAEKNKNELIKTERVISELLLGIKRGQKVRVSGRKGTYRVTRTVLSARGVPVVFGMLETDVNNRREVRLIGATLR